MYPRRMAFVIAVVAGLAFGGADQYLGSLSFLVLFGRWPSTVSQVSAPWLIVPFAFGCTQVRPRRAMLIGLAATQSALGGYFATTLSPIEGAHAGYAAIAGLLRSNLVIIVGGLIGGPLYGLLGQRWRVHRSWGSAAFVAGALCLEPVARLGVGQLIPPTTVWGVEVALGAAAATAFAVASGSHRRARRETPAG